jgi:3-deoxy-D-manno-octulosonic-acid transferase
LSGAPLSLRLYALATALAAPLAPSLLRGRVRRGKEEAGRIGERLGLAGVARPEGPLAWLHGASVGEALSLLPLIEAIRAARPDVTLLVTSGTVTSAALMARRLPPGVIHQYAPIDSPGAVAAFLDHWRPALGVFVEGELWPNLLLTAKARGARLAMLSAKLSLSSFRNWRRAPAAARSLYGVFDLILARDPAAAERLAQLGVPVAGIADLKFGAEPLPVDDAALQARRAEIGERAMVLAASTHPGEDELIVADFAAVRAEHPSALLVIAPRHPERGRAVADLAAAMGLRTAREQADEPIADADVFVADRLGELGLWFRLTRLAIIGGGLLPGVGGHNPLEPARLGVPFVFGPQVDNWSSVYQGLVEAEAARCVGTAQERREAIAKALRGDPALAIAAERAKAFAQAGDLAARSVPAKIVSLLP